MRTWNETTDGGAAAGPVVAADVATAADAVDAGEFAFPPAAVVDGLVPRARDVAVPTTADALADPVPPPSSWVPLVTPSEAWVEPDGDGVSVEPAMMVSPVTSPCSVLGDEQAASDVAAAPATARHTPTDISVRMSYIPPRDPERYAP